MPVAPVLGPALDFLLPIAVSFLHEADKFVVVFFKLRSKRFLPDIGMIEKNPPERAAMILYRGSSTHNQVYDEQNHKDHEQDPCALSRGAGNPSSAQDTGNKRDHQKSYCPT